MSPLGHRRCGHVWVEDLCDPTLYVQQDIYYDTATTPMTWVYSDVFRDHIDVFMNSSTALNGRRRIEPASIAVFTGAVGRMILTLGAL